MKWAKRIQFLTLPAGLVVVSGCSGVSASHSVSPIDFLIPGFGITQAEPVDGGAVTTDATLHPTARIENPIEI